MKWLQMRSVRVVGAFALLIVLALCASYIYLYGKYRAYEAEIITLEPRTARLLGLAASEEQLKREISRAQSGVDTLFIQQEVDETKAATEFQQNIRRIFTAVGMEISGSQVLPSRGQESFIGLYLDISVTGGVENLAQALIDIEGNKPLIFIDSMVLRPQRQRRNQMDQLVTAQLRIHALKVAAP